MKKYQELEAIKETLLDLKNELANASDADFEKEEVDRLWKIYSTLNGSDNDPMSIKILYPEESTIIQGGSDEGDIITVELEVENFDYNNESQFISVNVNKGNFIEQNKLKSLTQNENKISFQLNLIGYNNELEIKISLKTIENNTVIADVSETVKFVRQVSLPTESRKEILGLFKSKRNLKEQIESSPCSYTLEDLKGLSLKDLNAKTSTVNAYKGELVRGQEALTKLKQSIEAINVDGQSLSFEEFIALAYDFGDTSKEKTDFFQAAGFGTDWRHTIYWAVIDNKGKLLELTKSDVEEEKKRLDLVLEKIKLEIKHKERIISLASIPSKIKALRTDAEQIIESIPNLDDAEVFRTKADEALKVIKERESKVLGLIKKAETGTSFQETNNYAQEAEKLVNEIEKQLSLIQQLNKDASIELSDKVIANHAKKLVNFMNQYETISEQLPATTDIEDIIAVHQIEEVKMLVVQADALEKIVHSFSLEWNALVETLSTHKIKMKPSEIKTEDYYRRKKTLKESLNAKEKRLFETLLIGYFYTQLLEADDKVDSMFQKFNKIISVKNSKKDIADNVDVGEDGTIEINPYNPKLSDVMISVNKNNENVKYVHESYEGNPIAAMDEDDVHVIAMDDIEQGDLGNCYYLSAIAGIAQTNPDKIFGAENSIIKETEKEGVYLVNLNIPNEEGVLSPVKVKVDASFLVKKSKKTDFISGGSTNIGEETYNTDQVFSQTADQGEIWVKILEKAMAQVVGMYERIEGDHKNRLNVSAFAILNGQEPSLNVSDLNSNQTTQKEILNRLKAIANGESPMIPARFGTLSNLVVGKGRKKVDRAETYINVSDAPAPDLYLCLEHAYTLDEVSLNGNSLSITLFNPHNNDISKGGKNVVITWEELISYFNTAVFQ